MKNLFKSQTTYAILDLLILNKTKPFYLKELVNELGKDPANITRELNKLVKSNIINLTTKDKKKYYSLNLNYSSIQELIQLFTKNREDDFKEKFDTQWLLAEEIMNLDPFFNQMWCNCFVDEFANQGGRAYKKIASIFKDYHLWFYYDKQDACAVGEHLVNKFIKDPNFMTKVNDNIIKWSDKLRDYCQKIPETNLDKLSNKQLWEIYINHEDTHTKYYEWGWIPAAVDMFCDNLTNRGKEILRKSGVNENNLGTYLALLTQPNKPSLIKIEDDELKQIGVDIQKDPQQFKLFKELFKRFKEESVKEFGLYTHSPEYEAKFEKTVMNLRSKIRPGILDKLQNHYTKYFYTKFIFTEEQGTYSFEHYLKTLVRLVNSDPDIAKTLKEDEKEFKKIIQNRENLVKKLKLSENNLKIFNEWGDFMVTKIYRRYAQLFALYKMTFPLQEIASRFNLSLKETKFMTSDEIYDGLINNNIINKQNIKERVSFCIYYSTKNKIKIYTGDQAKQATDYIQKQKIGDISEIIGQCGARGQAKGTVKIVNVMADMQKMKPGDILVSISTQPDLLPAMKKAAAFVTDQGGVTSHAAIVAREMNTPCVIATKIATKVLKDGDQVEVNADKGIIKIIK